MAEPARQFEKDNEPGNADSAPPGKTELRVLEGGGEGSPPNSSWYQPDGGKDTASREKLSDSEDSGGESGQDSKDNEPQHENQVGQGYQPGEQQNFVSKVKKYSRRRVLFMGAGIGGAILIALVVAIFGFLNVFKLDDIMSNIDAKSFARLNGVEDRRSLSWMQAYMEMRLADIGDNPDLSKGADSDNAFFRAEKVNNNNPALDWYRTLRTSKFEQDVFINNGFKFVSVRTADGHIRAGKIILNGNTVDTVKMSDADFSNLMNGDTATIRKYNNLVDLQTFDTNGDARKAIKKAVTDETRFYQVFKQRQIRKDIQNMTGVTDWRFFDNTRTKISEKKIDIRNKIIASALPDSTKTGKFIQCLFGISDCTFSEDTSAPSNQTDGSLNGKPVADGSAEITAADGTTSTVAVPPNEATSLISQADAAAFASQALEKISGTIGAVNLVSTLDSLSNINSAIASGKLSKGVAIARGVQAMGLYTTFEIARDQIKTGQVNPNEVNDFMDVMGTVASSDAWTKVINGQGDPSKLDNSAKAKTYCSEKSQTALQKDPSLAQTDPAYSYAYLCPSQQIGSSSNNASTLEAGYNQSIGAVLGPLLTAYNKVRNAPIIGALLNFATGLINGITGTLTQIVINSLGLGSDVKAITSWIASQMASFLGAAPILHGPEPDGVYMNWIVQGGTYTAEATSRANGASATTAQSRAASQLAVAQYQHDQNAQMSTFTQYLSLSNPNSLTAKGAFAISQLKFSSLGNILGSIGSMFKSIGSAFSLPFSHRALAAASDNGYAAAQFAGIQTYDFPAQCYNLDPLQETPQNVTNIQQVLASKNIPDTALTWDIVSNSQSWYSFVYDEIGTDNNDPDKLALQIYNCALLDTSVRGSLGYLYGYTNDNGLGSSTNNSDAAVPSSPASGSATIDLPTLDQDSTNVACADGTRNLGTQTGYYSGNPVQIRLCAIPNLPSSGEESNGGYGVSGANGQAVVNSRVSGPVYAMVQAAANDGVNLTAASSFRSMAHQEALCAANARCNNGIYDKVAKPGTSNHQMGLAIDFGGGLPSTPGPVAGNAFWSWLTQNAANYGYKNYPQEAWHWSPTGN